MYSVDIEGTFEAKGIENPKDRLQFIAAEVREPFPETVCQIYGKTCSDRFLLAPPKQLFSSQQSSSMTGPPFTLMVAVTYVLVPYTIRVSPKRASLSTDLPADCHHHILASRERPWWLNFVFWSTGNSLPLSAQLASTIAYVDL